MYYSDNTFGGTYYTVNPWQYTTAATTQTLQTFTVLSDSLPPAPDPEPPTNIAWLRRRVNETCAGAFKDIAA